MCHSGSVYGVCVCVCVCVTVGEFVNAVCVSERVCVTERECVKVLNYSLNTP